MTAPCRTSCRRPASSPAAPMPPLSIWAISFRRRSSMQWQNRLRPSTGLSEQYVKETKLRISPTRFRKELLRDQDQILGRYDARFEAFDVDSAGENPGFDPSSTGNTGPYVTSFHEYLQSELKYMSSEPYYLHGPGTENWNWEHRPSGVQGNRPEPQPDTVLDLADAMRKNPHLKVFSANGWFDLATPFFGTEHDIAQMMLPPAIASNVQFGYYPAGHMVYLNVECAQADACGPRPLVSHGHR